MSYTCYIETRQASELLEYEKWNKTGVDIIKSLCWCICTSLIKTVRRERGGFDVTNSARTAAWLLPSLVRPSWSLTFTPDATEAAFRHLLENLHRTSTLGRSTDDEL